MKRLINLGCILTCLGIADFSWSQNANYQKKSMPLDSNNPIVCNLTPPEFQERTAELEKKIFAQVVEHQELEDGYIFHFKDEDNFLDLLVHYVLAEQKCCPFFQFDLVIKAYGQGLSLTLSGPPEAKEMIKMMVMKKP